MSNKSNIDKLLERALPVASLLIHSWREATLVVTVIYHTIRNKGE